MFPSKLIVYHGRNELPFYGKVVAWFALHSTNLSQLLRMRVMATPNIFYLSKKY